MKCPKCGYHSFDHLDSCKKCNNDLVEHKAKFNLSGFPSPGQAAAPAPKPVNDDTDTYEDIEEAADGPVDFGFDFLDEEEQAGGATEDIPLGDDDQDINTDQPFDAKDQDIDTGQPLDANGQDINIDQPFGADSETLPADTFNDDDDDDKPAKGPEFAF